MNTIDCDKRANKYYQIIKSITFSTRWSGKIQTSESGQKQILIMAFMWTANWTKRPEVEVQIVYYNKSSKKNINTHFSPATAVFFYVHHIFYGGNMPPYRIFISQVYILNAILLMLIVLHVTADCLVMCNRYISKKDTFNSSFAFNQ